MNKEQKAYALAKAKVDVLKCQQEKNEAEFIRKSGYYNPDGKIPTVLYAIEDEAEYERLCKAFDVDESNLFNKQCEAEQALRTAEDNMIDYALSITPEPARSILAEVRNEYKYHQKLVDLAFRLDTSTVPV